MSKTIGIEHLAGEIAAAIYGPGAAANEVFECVRATLRNHLPDDVAELQGKVIACERANQAIHDRAVQEIKSARAAAPSAPVWPHFAAPPKYDNPHPTWADPALPDFAKIWDVARSNGYAIGLHGSMRRDVDLIAVPWTDDAVRPALLIQALCIALNARLVGASEAKPHGRVAVTLQIDGWFKPIDLSIWAPARRSQEAQRG